MDLDINQYADLNIEGAVNLICIKFQSPALPCVLL